MQKPQREGNKYSLNRTSLSDQIYEALKELIMDVEMEPGERIQVDRLEEEFEVSRAPIREALNRLANQGLVEVEPRVGYFVVDLELSQIEELYDMRELFEIYALSHSLSRIDDDELQELRQETVALLESELSYEELRSRFDVTDQRLHWELIIGNSDNQYLHQLSKRIYDLVYFTRHLVERIPEALEEHLVIIDGISDRDCDAVESALRDHIENHLNSLKEKGFSRTNQFYGEKQSEMVS